MDETAHISDSDEILFGANMDRATTAYRDDRNADPALVEI
jgi:hypothetical protein